MAFTRVCSLDDVWEGDMAAYEVDGQSIVLVYPIDGEVIAIQGFCPHQQFSLAEGDFDGHKVLTCSAHVWQFDVTTGQGINPQDCELARYPVKIEHDEIYVDVIGIEPKRVGV